MKLKKVFLTSTLLVIVNLAYTQSGNYVYKVFDKNLKLFKTFYGKDGSPELSDFAVFVSEDNKSHIYYLDGKVKKDLPYINLEPNNSYIKAFVKKTDSWSTLKGLLDKNGNQILPCIFGNIGFVGNDLVDVEDAITEKKGYYDLKGNEVIKPQYNYVSQFVSGVAKVKGANDKNICINKKNEIVVCKFEIYGLIAEEKRDSLLYYNKTGKRMFALPNHRNLAGEFINGKAFMYDRYYGGRYFIININGEVIKELKIDNGDDYYSYTKGGLLEFVKHNKNNSDDYARGINDMEGNEILAPVYDFIKVVDNSQNRFIVAKKNVNGYDLIDKKGKVLLHSPNYISASGNGNYLTIEENKTDENTITKKVEPVKPIKEKTEKPSLEKEVKKTIAKETNKEPVKKNENVSFFNVEFLEELAKIDASSLETFFANKGIKDIKANGYLENNINYNSVSIIEKDIDYIVLKQSTQNHFKNELEIRTLSSKLSNFLKDKYYSIAETSGNYTGISVGKPIYKY
jgi:hypothetical protein